MNGSMEELRKRYDLLVAMLSSLLAALQKEVTRVGEGYHEVVTYQFLVGLVATVRGITCFVSDIGDAIFDVADEVRLLRGSVEAMTNERQDLLSEIHRLRLEAVELRRKLPPQPPKLPVSFADLSDRAKFLMAVDGGRKIKAIKAAREFHDIGLADAKNLMEAWAVSPEAFEYREHCLAYLVANRKEKGYRSDEVIADEWANWCAGCRLAGRNSDGTRVTDTAA